MQSSELVSFSLEDFWCFLAQKYGLIALLFHSLWNLEDLKVKHKEQRNCSKSKAGDGAAKSTWVMPEKGNERDNRQHRTKAEETQDGEGQRAGRLEVILLHERTEEEQWTFTESLKLEVCGSDFRTAPRPHHYSETAKEVWARFRLETNIAHTHPYTNRSRI